MDMNQFIQHETRTLPVILLLDVSGSMSEENKIHALNRSIKEMIKQFSEETTALFELQVAIITFGEEVKQHIELTAASKIQWKDMIAKGSTPLGGALEIAKKLVEDKTKISSRSYRPIVILVSDGTPYGEPEGFWQEKMNEFINEGRSKKCDRFAMAIGPDADVRILERFLGKGEKRVFKASDASQIIEFFRDITSRFSDVEKEIPDSNKNSQETFRSNESLQEVIEKSFSIDKEIEDISAVNYF